MKFKIAVLSVEGTEQESKTFGRLLFGSMDGMLNPPARQIEADTPKLPDNSHDKLD